MYRRFYQTQQSIKHHLNVEFYIKNHSKICRALETRLTGAELPVLDH
jgi:hypothetical protein